MSRRLNIRADVIAAQRRAADPSTSVWVEANAGSGKTHVLTQRVLRLLLSGVAPEEILCLTYTKAAAAEMRARVARRLASWSVADESELDRELFEITGDAAAVRHRQRARTLFAHALDTPGGLKVQTIHAFCESVLHRFPLEAGVPFDFAVIEDHQRDEMILRARETVIAAGLRGEADIGAVETVFGLLSDFSIGESIEKALAAGRRLTRILEVPDRAKAELRKLVGLAPDETRDSVLQEVCRGYSLSDADHAAALGICPPTGKDGFEDRLAVLDRTDPDALFAAFLTKTFTVPAKFPRAALQKADPALSARLRAEAERLERLADRLKRATLVDRSEAFLDILAAIRRRYETEKRARALLDFDDLIEKLRALLADAEQGPWVRYKLDAGLTHILVDESQDTNPEQWAVVRQLADEFFSGQSAVERPRTLFAVGDGKQSIYSFQGAEPKLFSEAGREFGAKAEVVQMRFRRERLKISFRSLPQILAAVDSVFADPMLQLAVLETEPVQHETTRAEQGGTVTLWPPVQVSAQAPDPNNWPLTAPDSLKSAPRQVAERIATEIASWVRERRPLGQRGRPVRPEDVLILVQSRSALFHELIRALIRAGLPTPGADRLAVTEHMGVLDLLALGDVLLNADDDLQLAALLRSPLFAVSEDELFALAQPRPLNATLWQALRQTELPVAKAAYETLRGWRQRLEFERPYNFYVDVLYTGGGLRKFHDRFGAEIDDVFSAFLDLALEHEQADNPSLQGFLAEMRSREVIISRELSEVSNGVRIMTVHGAKGLEAPIVILADCATKPFEQSRKPIVLRENPPLLIHGSKSEDHCPETQLLRDEDKAVEAAEYWRKLYVGMTRAEDELYLTGVLTPSRDGSGQLKGSWWEAVERALRPGCEEVRSADGELEALIFPRERPAQFLRDAPDVATTATASVAFKPLPPHRPVEVVRPSAAFLPTASELRVLETAAEATLSADDARKEGIALHALLQHMGRVPWKEWPQVAEKALSVLLPDSPARHALVAKKAVSILGRLELKHIFGPDSRAEVPILAEATRDGKPIRLAGRIDRLVVTDDEVLVVDFKSDGRPSLNPADTPKAYLTQLGLYALVARELFPTHRVKAAILWTALESLAELPGAALTEATRGFTIR